MEKPAVLITGASGLVGSRIVELLQHQYTFYTPNSDELDILKPEQIASYLVSHPVRFCLHLAAYTNVDGAETNYDTAYALNVTGTKNLFHALDQHEIKGILFSTDFVFDGTNPPYIESSRTNPISAYGKTKLLAEQEAGNRALIIRIAYPYRGQFAGKKDFVRTVASLLEQGTTLKMITDGSFTPTFIDDIAISLPPMLEQFQPGIRHTVGDSHLSMYDAGKHIAQTFGYDQELIKPISYAEYFRGKAQRPQYSAIKTEFPPVHPMRSFEDGLTKVLTQQEQNDAG